MKSRKILKLNINISVFLICLITVASFPAISRADVASSVYDMLDFYGDFRFRFEEDWDSARSSGALRSDRARARIRARIGLKITPNDVFQINPLAYWQ